MRDPLFINKELYRAPEHGELYDMRGQGNIR